MPAAFSRPFTASIELLGVNPFVFVPEDVLQAVFAQVGTDKGRIRVELTIDGHAFGQTLVKYRGHWRLYLNTPMRRAAGKQVGDTAVFALRPGTAKPSIAMPVELGRALAEAPAAQAVFDGLPASRQQEIVRYVSSLKTEASVTRNVQRAVRFLLGQERFIGRGTP